MAKEDSSKPIGRAFGYIATATFETHNHKQEGAPNVYSVELTPDPTDSTYVQGTVIRLGVIDGPVPIKPGTHVKVYLIPED